MKRMAAWLRNLWALYITWESQRMIRWVRGHTPEEWDQYIREAVQNLAIGVTQLRLQREGLQHCAYCTARWNLRRFVRQQGGKVFYACQGHLTAATRDAA